ncbi:MAG: glycosyltransferase family 2 protein [SAR324 cluster bacterium]|nr:glycosyltransferase family 2 protein [SAR324 cluster bacterium]
MPLITVIIPTYNRAHWLPHAIESVLTQTVSDFELVVVDDGSRDSTPEMLSRFESSLQTITLPENRGVSAARNSAIQKSDSRWIAFLDSDDRWLPQKLEKQLQHLQQIPHAKIHFTDEIWIRQGKRINPKKKHHKQEGWIFQPSLSLCLMAPSTIMIEREVFERTGMFDEDLPVCEDYDLWLRITAQFPVYLLKEKLMIRYGGHSDQLSGRSWGNDQYRVISLQKIIKSIPLSPDDHRAAVSKLIEKCQILILGFQKRGKHAEIAQYQQIIKNHQGIL